MGKIYRARIAAAIGLSMALASSASAGEQGLHLAMGVMALTNSTEQGGQGPKGSTILTQTELVYHGPWWGLGGYFQYDMQGSNEKDTAVGPKGELHFGPFYFQGGYSLLMQKAFTDRSIAKQTGKGWVFGVGARFKLGASSGSTASGPFLQFTYVYRIQNVEKQDGVVLSEPISQKDGYPLFGIGIIF